MKLEVVATDLNDIELINKSNADRIEFCNNLKVGGLTPSIKDIYKSGQISKKPVHVMLRPTSRDFVYTDDEFSLMLTQLGEIIESDIKGIVVGILTNKNKIDIKRMKVIMKNKGDKKVTFHKAFDELKNFKKGFKQLKKLGVDTILTSAGPNIDNNLSMLDYLSRKRGVNILAGGGISFKNIQAVKQNANEIHVGSCVRVDSTWNTPVDVDKINKMKLEIEK